VRHRIIRRAVPLVGALACLQPAAAAAQAEHWQPPVVGPVHVLRAFAPPTAPWGPGHRGVDLAAAPGEPVLAAGAGTVRFAGQVGGRGVVVVEHNAGLRTEYEPVVPVVRVGDRPAAGAVLGVLAPISGHCGVVSCLHWGLRRNGAYLDPMRLLIPTQAPVLLPFLDPQPHAGRPAASDPAPRLVAAGAAVTGGTGLAAMVWPGSAGRLRPGRRAGRSPLSRASGTPDSR
jgi:murein DD-endopeptidase MepM/ murein hydrolase activator NlpD